MCVYESSGCTITPKAKISAFFEKFSSLSADPFEKNFKKSWFSLWSFPKLHFFRILAHYAQWLTSI